MKKTIIILSILFTSWHLKAQNAPVVEKAAPKSNNTLPSNGTLGSNSGVNPAGNPGTILSYTGNSNSGNTKLAPNPNIEPGTFLTSSPEGTVMAIPGTNVPSVQKVTVSQKVKPVIDNNNTVATLTIETPKPSPITVVTSPPAEVTASSTITAIVVPSKGKEVPSYSPVLGNYVPEEVIKKVKDKYNSVYDIKTIRIVATNKVAYMVRLFENGQFRNELYYDTP